MDLNDGFGLLEAMCQARVFHPELLVRFRQGIESRSTAPLLGREPLECTLLPLTPPGSQVGGIQAFPAQQSADGALVAAGLGLVEDRPFVGSRELAPPGLGRDLGVGDRRPDGGDPRLVWSGTPSLA